MPKMVTRNFKEISHKDLKQLMTRVKMRKYGLVNAGLEVEEVRFPKDVRGKCKMVDGYNVVLTYEVKA